MNGLYVRAAGAGRQHAPAALDLALLGDPSTSPLDSSGERIGVRGFALPAGPIGVILRL